MSSEIETIEPSLPRAGFWRRAVAFFIDCAIVLIPVSLFAGILFSVTDGRIYMSSPFLRFSSCSPQTSYPSTLKPAPPADTNFISSCKIYTVSGMTANVLIVGRKTVDGHVTSTVSQSYALNRSGEPIDGTQIDVSWFGGILVFLLIIPMQCRVGRTFGQMAMSTRLILATRPVPTKIPLSKLLLRYFFAYIFPLVFFIPLIAWYFLPFTTAMVVTVFFCVVPSAYWAIGNLGLIIQRRDPWFDRWSGLAEIKTQPGKPVTPPLPAALPPLPHP